MDGEGVKNNQKRKKAFIIAGAAVGIVLIGILVFLYRDYRATHVTTDDAFVEGNIHTIASKVPGTVRALHVRDNQAVKKGDLLVEIDETDLEVKVREASSAVETERRKLAENGHRLDTARKQVAEITASIRAATAGAEAQEANLEQARLDMKRAENLVKSEAISRERYDRTRTALGVNDAQLKAAREQVKRLEASLSVQQSLLQQLEAALATQKSVIDNKAAVLDGARLSRSYTRLYAPVDGHVTKKAVVVGNQIAAGQPLMALVPLGDVWVIANFKETQVEKFRPGQKVEITVDTYPGKTFSGTMDSITAGTGSTFSLFPAENATGNYVKVVQRIPVKILLDADGDKDRVLRVGMSVVPTVIVK
jgi:membrane fusion protein, multidrug efflux system